MGNARKLLEGLASNVAIGRYAKQPNRLTSAVCATLYCRPAGSDFAAARRLRGWGKPQQAVQAHGLLKLALPTPFESEPSFLDCVSVPLCLLASCTHRHLPTDAAKHEARTLYAQPSPPSAGLRGTSCRHAAMSGEAPPPPPCDGTGGGCDHGTGLRDRCPSRLPPSAR